MAIIRSLGRRGHRVVAASDNTLVPGFASRWVSKRVRLPRATEDPGGAARALAEAAAESDVVIPVTDSAIHLLRSRREVIPGHVVVAVAEDEALEQTMDKTATLELARTLGVPVPQTVVVAGPSDVDDVVAELAPPWIVKPARSVTFEGGRATARRVSHAVDRAGLVAALEVADPALVQTWLPGLGVGLDVLAHEGRLVAALQHRRIRETPWTGGASSCRVTEQISPDLLAHAAQLMEALRWSGLAMVEFRRSDAGAVLMEINGRVWGSLPLATSAGMDFPGQLVDQIFGERRAADVDTAYRVGVRSRDLELERQWVAGAWRAVAPFPGPVPPTRRQAIAVAAEMLVPRGLDSGDIRDPLPLAVKVAKVTGAAARGFVRLLRSRDGGG